MIEVKRGEHVVVRDAVGTLLPRRALSPVQPGGDFLVVWVCRDEEWEAAQREDREPEGVPWPAEDVHFTGAVTSP
jgi:hypothetical protein